MLRTADRHKIDPREKSRLSLAALAPKAGASALYRLKIQRLEKVEKHEWQF